MEKITPMSELEIERDLDYLYGKAMMIHKRPTEKNEDDYLARIRVLVVDQNMTDTAARSKAFNEVMIK